MHEARLHDRLETTGPGLWISSGLYRGCVICISIETVASSDVSRIKVIVLARDGYQSVIRSTSTLGTIWFPQLEVEAIRWIEQRYRLGRHSSRPLSDPEAH